MQEEAFDARVVFEIFDSSLLVDACEADFELAERSSKDIEEVFELREDDGLGAGVVLADPEQVPSQGVNFGTEGAFNVDVFDL